MCRLRPTDARPQQRLSTPVPQPHGVQQNVDDVVAFDRRGATADAANVRRPLLTASSSTCWRAPIPNSSRHRHRRRGVELLTTLGRPAQNTAFQSGHATPPDRATKPSRWTTRSLEFRSASAARFQRSCSAPTARRGGAETGRLHADTDPPSRTACSPTRSAP